MKYSEATWIPSPNFGYPRDTHGQLKARVQEAGKSGEFWHSQVGRQSVSIAMFQNPATEVSAHFLFPKVGKPVQMVDSNDPAWHAGGFVANAYYHGFEFEGGPPGNLSEPLTANQIAWGVKVTHWLRTVHRTPARYVRRDTLWEHNEVKNTACPSGRIPWLKVIAALGATAPEPEEEEDEMAKEYAVHSNGRTYAFDGPYRVWLSPSWLGSLKGGLDWKERLPKMTDRQIEVIPERPTATSGDGSGLTFDQTKRAVKDAGKEGTG